MSDFIVKDEYRLVFPDENRQTTFLKCYVGTNQDFRFLRKGGEFYEFFHHGSLTSISGAEKLKDDVKFGEKKVEFHSKIEITDTRSYLSVVESVFEQYKFFKSLKEDVLDKGWYDLYQIDTPRLVHDRKIDMPENLDQIIKTIANYNPEKTFGIKRN